MVYLLLDARQRIIHVSEQMSFTSDFKENYSRDDDVKSEINTVTKLFKEEDEAELKSEYNDHELTEGDLDGFRSLHLFAGTAKDVVLVCIRHSGDGHVVFHRLGTHEEVYDPEYEAMDKKRQMKKGSRW